MKRSLRILLILVLAAIMAVGSVALADPAENGSGEDSGDAGDANRRNRSYYYDPFLRYFRLFDLPVAIRVRLDLGGADETGDAAEASGDTFAAAGDDAAEGWPALTEEALAQAAKALAGKVIGLDPGHQCVPDLGLEAIAPGSNLEKIRQSAGCAGIRSGAPEYRINLLVAQKLRQLLEACGATVVMTRVTSEVSLSNIERAAMMNESGAAIWIRLHCNASRDYDQSGACVLLPSESVTPEIYPESLHLGECIALAFAQATEGAAAPLVPLDNQAGFNWSRIPVVTLEMGYLTNAKDDALLNSDAYQARCALGIFDGMVRYFLSITPPEDAAAPSDVPGTDGPSDQQEPGNGNGQ